MKALKLTALLLLVGVVLLATLMIFLLSPADAESETKQDFVVTAGQRSNELAQQLEKDGLIKNSFAFYLYLKLIGGKILPGTYELAGAFSASEIAEIIASGRFKTTRITIIEGWRANQMEKYFVEEKNLAQLRGFTVKAEPYEGYLFPDTYEVKVDTTIEEVISLMRRTFEQKTDNLKVTPETVILASIVEREAKSEADRPLIAGVYVNRIKLGMKLEADPTVQYAKGSWASITRDDYRSVISPYNTYLNDLWPPGPISSPGLSSIKAALDPASHDYLFFFHAKGETHFSKTFAEHSAKVRQYF